MQVVCDHCGKPVRVFSETATSMPCPHCGKEVALSPAAPAEPPDSALTELEGYAAVAKSVRRGRIDFICGQCNKRLAAQLDSAGKTVTCPNCRSSLQVPELEDGAAATSAAAPTGDGSVFDDDLRLTTGPAMAAPAQTVPAPQAADLLVASPAGSVRPANGNGKNPKTARKRSLSTILAVVGGIILAAAIALAATHFLTEDVGPTGGDEIGEIDQPFPADVVTVDDPGESDQPGPDVAFVEDDPVDTSASDAPGGPREPSVGRNAHRAAHGVLRQETQGPQEQSVLHGVPYSASSASRLGACSGSMPSARLNMSFAFRSSPSTWRIRPRW